VPIKTHSVFDPSNIFPAVGESFKTLNPVTLARNPVMFVTEVAAAISTILLATVGGAMVLPALIALALKGVNIRPLTPDEILAKNLFSFGLGGILLPFLGTGQSTCSSQLRLGLKQNNLTY
jgi:potassium-transporting ATPase ATP-binding subunit